MAPTLRSGKICYIELPAADPAASAEFYRAVFGWNVRHRGNGAVAFDDTTGEVSGQFVTGRPPSTQESMIVYIMIDDIDAAAAAVTAAGGEIVKPVDRSAPELFAYFADPAGNVLALYQERG